ncbi:hypothetical protein [Labrenzia sp. R5_0]|uniref:hypothetical protein n=1 Tax=Labrenzia sp. R5_0 TaxID=2821108 RepID=UPI001ADBDCF6|nr:hypothetical protein [Labrenzia sp. R5_0]MBO9457923.1 hypothetical protein [Labrenzia sp. R5_0]
MPSHQKLDQSLPIYFNVQEVAERLRKSKRWLEGVLAEDKRRRPSEQLFQFHLRHGRTKVWTPEALTKLQAAVARESEPGGALAGSPRSTVMASGTFTEPSGLADAQSALEKVLGFKSPLSPRTPQSKSAGASKAKSSLKCRETGRRGLTLVSPQQTS